MSNGVEIAVVLGLFLLIAAAGLAKGHPATQPVTTRAEHSPTIGRLLDAIRQVESGGNANAVGDGGKAHGAYQMHESFWRDAWSNLAVAPGYYANVRSDAMCRTTILRYWNRYAPGELVALMDPLSRPVRKLTACERLARIYNGGPKGDRKRATVKYWDRVLAVLEPR